ncbi:hypothetical protein RIF29_28944 [Crotalaria pallida]|uniref:Uncharacterized protein n=1 Tax=Crotalaria pallida TaxID=3830 RepID=A0AAN9EDV7_CROPI
MGSSSSTTRAVMALIENRFWQKRGLTRDSQNLATRSKSCNGRKVEQNGAHHSTRKVERVSGTDPKMSHRDYHGSIKLNVSNAWRSSNETINHRALP